MTESAIRVMVVDDQVIVRRGLSTMIDAEPDMEVVGEASDGMDAVDVAARVRPDVMLMDVQMPRQDGISATRAVLAAGSAKAVVIVTTFDDEDLLLQGVEAGAAGFLLKDSGPDLIAAAVRCALQGDAVIDPQMTRALVERQIQERRSLSAPASPAQAPGGDRFAALSERERDVLALLARGLSNADIAGELWLSETTVKTHVSNLHAKLGVQSRLQAAVFAYESGFVRPGWLEGGVRKDA